MRHIANMAGVRKESDAKWAVREKHLCDKRDAKLVGEKAARQYQLQYLINVRTHYDTQATIISYTIVATMVIVICDACNDMMIGTKSSLACCCSHFTRNLRKGS